MTWFVLFVTSVALFWIYPRLRRQLHAYRDRKKSGARKRARQIAIDLSKLLKRGLVISRGNPYFGGHGLRYAESTFIRAAVNDGHIWSPSEAREYKETDRFEFTTTQAFTDWLEDYLTSPVGRSPYSAINVHRLRRAVETYDPTSEDDLTGYIA